MKKLMDESVVSLTALAEKKGYMDSVKIREGLLGWRITFSNGNVFAGKTYAEAKTKALEYLNRLEDKK